MFLTFVHGLYSVDYDYLQEYLQQGEVSQEEIENILEEYRENPLVLSECSLDDIMNLPVDPELKYKLLLNIDSIRMASTWRELKEKAKLSETELSLVKSFFVIRGEEERNIGVLNQIFFASDEKSGLDICRNKFKCGYSHSFLRFYFTGEYDRGERRLFDYGNASVVVSNFPVRAVNAYAGSFRVKWGYGLLYSSSLYSSLARNGVGNFSVREPGLVPYTGADENNFFRGCALYGGLESCNVMMFISDNFIDSKIEGDTVVSFMNSGYHVTPGQVASRKNLNEKAFGVGVDLRKDGVRSGVLLSHVLYAKPLKCLDCRKSVKAVSLYYKLRGDFINSGGEFLLINGKVSVVGNIVVSPGAFKVGIGYRYLNERYFSRLGAVKKYYSSYNFNEEGVLYVFEARFMGNRINLMVDFHRRVDIGSAEFGWGRLLCFRVARIKAGRWSVVLDVADDSTPPKYIRQFNVRYRFALGDRIVFKNTLCLKMSGTRESAFALSPYVSYINDNVSVKFGVSEYCVGKGIRISVYEPSIPYYVDFVNLYGNGYRFFIAFEGHLSKCLELAIVYKFSRSSKDNVEVSDSERVMMHMCYNF